jgi:tRNA(fMet)-specific endonuclease VapC
MARYLLDTNVLSQPIAREPDPAVMRRLAARSPDCVTAAPVLHELRFGARRLVPSKRRLAIERYVDDVVLRLYEVLPYDRVAAERHAEERARLAARGQSPPWIDGAIAAIALVHGLVLVTANLRDFQRFSGLGVESWAR